MASILVVEDDSAIADLIALYLRRDAHDVCIQKNGLDGLQAALTSQPPFDLLVLDLMLPGLDGRGIARRVREVSSVPILMLTALDDDRDRLEGFELGADDYVGKPFNPDELVARVRAILKRTRSTESSPPQAERLICGNLELDLAARCCLVNGVELELRTKELDLIRALILNKNVVLSRDHLLELVWNNDYDGDTRTVDVHVSRLRARLESGGADVSIDTIRSVGYRLRLPK